ncbi:hypothetical protein TRVL_02344 [Trypanosoma vivax]|nr:hypothetical protein TRVL_02344 [Trypanosoma vivax]
MVFSSFFATDGGGVYLRTTKRHAEGEVGSTEADSKGTRAGEQGKKIGRLSRSRLNEDRRQKWVVDARDGAEGLSYEAVGTLSLILAARRRWFTPKIERPGISCRAGTSKWRFCIYPCAFAGKSMFVLARLCVLLCGGVLVETAVGTEGLYFHSRSSQTDQGAISAPFGKQVAQFARTTQQ